MFAMSAAGVPALEPAPLNEALLLVGLNGCWLFTFACLIGVLVTLLGLVLRAIHGERPAWTPSTGRRLTGWTMGTAVGPFATTMIGDRLPTAEFPLAVISTSAVMTWCLAALYTMVGCYALRRAVRGGLTDTGTGGGLGTSNVLPAGVVFDALGPKPGRGWVLRGQASAAWPSRWEAAAVKTAAAGLPPGFGERLRAIGVDLHDLGLWAQTHPHGAVATLRHADLATSTLQAVQSLRDVPPHLRTRPRGPEGTTPYADAVATLVALHAGVRQLCTEVMGEVGQDLAVQRRYAERYLPSALDLGAPAPVVDLTKNPRRDS